MKRLADLQSRQQEIDARQKAILAEATTATEGELTEAQRTEFDALGVEYDKNNGDIETLAKDAERASKLASRVPTKVIIPAQTARSDNGAPLVTNTRTDEQGRVVSYMEETDEEIELRFGESREASLQKTYKQQRVENNKLLKSRGYQPWNTFTSANDFIRQGLASHGTEGFASKVRQHHEKMLTTIGMGEAVGSEGGYLVMPELATRIVDRVYKNDLWSRTDNYNVTGNSMSFVTNAETSRANGSRAGGMRGYWLGEGATKTPSAPTFRMVTMKLVKLVVMVYLTDELLEDTGNVLTQYITKKAAEEFNFLLGDALINGTGVGQPLGVLNWPSLVSVAKEPGQLADTLETENIIKMFSRFYGPNRDNMIWLHNQDVEPELFTMTLGVGTGGVVTYMPPGGLSSAPYATLMGRPSMATEFNPTLGDQGDILAWDPAQMLSISKGGIAQAVSIHVQFVTDQTALRFVMRCNAGPWEVAPLTPYRGAANTQSNAVVIDAR